MRSLILAVLLLILSNPAQALESCRKCNTSIGVQHVWGGCGGFQDVGEGDPRKCDANGGVFRYGPQNDPYKICRTNNADHSIAIGGNDDDLILIGNNNTPIEKWDHHRIQDGVKFKCGVDVKSIGHFSVVKYGSDRDLMDIFVRNSSGKFQRNKFRLQNGKNHAIEVGPFWVARVYGNDGDIVFAYQVYTTGQIVGASFSLFDGRNHIIERMTTGPHPYDFGIRYGNDKDIRARFCFRSHKWKLRGFGIGNPYLPDC